MPSSSTPTRRFTHRPRSRLIDLLTNCGRKQIRHRALRSARNFDEGVNQAGSCPTQAGISRLASPPFWLGNR